MATSFSQFYGLVSLTMSTAEGLFGRDTVDRVFAAYFERWRFRHPRFEDFLDVARDVGGEDFATSSSTPTLRPDSPTIAVRTAETELWSPPRGRVVTASGVIDSLEESGEPFAALDPAARESAGRVLAEIHDPGRSRTERVPSPDARSDPEPGTPRRGLGSAG